MYDVYTLLEFTMIVWYFEVHFRNIWAVIRLGSVRDNYVLCTLRSKFEDWSWTVISQVQFLRTQFNLFTTAMIYWVDTFCMILKIKYFMVYKRRESTKLALYFLWAFLTHHPFFSSITRLIYTKYYNYDDLLTGRPTGSGCSIERVVRRTLFFNHTVP